ncbi:YveK family protein [Peribacillus sp. NPDC097206]|uniref:YveK family protein n=1 Tax=unclassified Peribacillus TaxID=2675266 RepID=UPI00381FD011
MEETISLKELFMTLKKRWGWILGITVLAVLVAAIVSFNYLPSVYQASTQLLVNQANDEKGSNVYSSNEVQTNLQLINTYTVIIKSPAILDIVNEELGLELSTKQLNDKISVQSEQDSQVLNVTVQDEKHERAVMIANTTASVFQREITEIMAVDNVKILARAEYESNPAQVQPKPLLNIAIALVVGLMASIGLIFLLEYLDNTVKTEQDIEQILGVPVLGAIMEINEKKEKKSKIRSSTAVGKGVKANG